MIRLIPQVFHKSTLRASRWDRYFFNHFSVFSLLGIQIFPIHLQMLNEVLQDRLVTRFSLIFITHYVFFHRGQEILVDLLLEPVLPANEAFAHCIPSALFIFVPLCNKINVDINIDKAIVKPSGTAHISERVSVRSHAYTRKYNDRS